MDGSSRLDAIKTPKVERVLLKQYHHCREYVTGTLCLTDRHLIFIEPTGAKESWLLYHHIQNVERKPLTTKGYPLVIDCKTFQQLNLIIPRESDCLDVMDTIKKFSQPEKYRDLFAFQYMPKEGELVKQSSGWALYDASSEYSRMGVPNEHWKATTLNENYEMCDTYSSTLYVPAKADDSVLQGSAKFRSRGRLPALSYYYPPKQSAMCRSSQPLVGLRGRSTEDEQMVQCIIDANPNAEDMYMIDTRPKINAMANKAAGKGYESTDHYNNVSLEFYNIHNIHVMRESLQKLIEASCSPKESISGFLTGIESSGWLKHVHLVLEASIFSAKAMCEEGKSVLVHCSDGWDRTAQTCALTSLLIDSYYRTLHGFMILIEKEWLSFGHKFSVRSGHLAGEARETSPIFTQFLDCVWQIMIQFPTAFQFNEHFLVTLHDHVYSCQFGTFLGNNEKERLLNMFSEQTYSLWGYIWAHLDDFINPLYAEQSSDEKLLLPNTDIPHLSFWVGLYCRYPLRQHVCELSDEVTGSLKQQNTCLTEHIKFLQQKIEDLKSRLTMFEEEKAHSVSSSFGAEKNRENNVLKKDDEHNGQEKDREDSCLEKDNDIEKEEAKSANSHTADSYSKQSPNQELVGDAKVNGCLDEVKDEVQDDGGGKKIHCDESSVVGKEEEEEMSTNHHQKNQTDKARPCNLQVPPSSQCESAETDSDVTGKAPSEVMSPRSYSFFKSSLEHVPEMNLPWESMRNTSQCGCGVTFSFSIRKYHCSHCGCVVCSSCGNHQAASPWQTTPKPHRVCRSCFRMMKKIMQEIDIER